MQTRGTFPGLNGGQSRSPIKPQSTSAATVGALQRGTKPYTVGPPKRRRQITATPPKPAGNPFGALQGVLGKALKGQPY